GARLLVRDTARVRDTVANRPRFISESDATGAFRIVGLPPGSHMLEVTRDEFEPAGFQFTIASGVTVQLRIRLVPDVVWVQAKAYADSLDRIDSIARATLPRTPIGPRDSRLATRVGNISGRVVSTTGAPVGRVQVQAMGTTITTLTDTSGYFRLTEMPIGPYFLRARKVGFEPVVFSTQVLTNDSLEATITLTALSAGATSLDTMRVTADYDRLSKRLRGFEDRRENARGVFVDRKEIATRRPTLLSDLLRGRANITVQRNGTGDTQIFGPRLSMRSGYCALALIVDGTLIQTAGGRIDNFVPIDMVAAIEVYTSGTSVPSEFARPDTDCGAIIVWTR
ncbi:MAG TPA: carboxypeptidase regulatory-like domain-containing protein, partial [Gemmatimonas sp.]|nr:carboxypeptidase regulatory-like domain-containing protein [Gemmatimonas sp.]